MIKLENIYIQNECYAIYKHTQRDCFNGLQHMKTISALCKEIIYEDIVGEILLEFAIRWYSTSGALYLNGNHP